MTALVFACASVALTLVTTPAAAVPPPYLETFDGETDCPGNISSCLAMCPAITAAGWSNALGDTADWFPQFGATTSMGTGPQADHTSGAGLYLYTEASNCFFSSFHLLSPSLDTLNVVQPIVSFWAHMSGADMGQLHVDASIDGGVFFTNDVIPAIAGDQGNAWFQVTVDLSAFAPSAVVLRLRAITGPGFASDIAIDDFGYTDGIAPDVGVVSVDAPETVGCGLGNAEAITVTIQNFSGAAASNFPVQYALDGGAAVSEMFTGSIAAFSTAQYTFTATADFSAAGSHQVDASTLAFSDPVPGNDGISAFVINSTAAVVTAFPTLQDFEGGSGDWIAAGTSSSWELGTPAKFVISGAASGVNAWVTSLNGSYPNNESSAVTSGCGYDFSALVAPTLSLSVWWEAETSWDGAVLQSSIDGGDTWVNVGAFGDSGWYTDNTIFAAPGGSQEGWSGAGQLGSLGWVKQTHVLTGLGGQSNVKLRIAFASDPFVIDDGFAFDDVAIFDNASPGLDVYRIATPVTSVDALAPSQTDVWTQVFELAARGPNPLDVTSIEVSKAGTIADAQVAAVKLWTDDGDGTFEPSADTLVGTQTFAAGSATFATAITVPFLGTTRHFLSIDVAANPTPGATIGTRIANAATDIVVSGNPPVSAVNPPIDGPLFAIGGIASTLPFSDDFSGGVLNRYSAGQIGTSYPEANNVGITILTSSPSANASRQRLLPTVNGLAPVAGTQVYAADFPAGLAYAGLDYRFDLSAYDAGMDALWLRFRWADGSDETSLGDYVFVSFDGGTTWSAAVFQFDPGNNPDNTWSVDTVDLSALLDSFGLQYSNDVVIRFQASDNNPIPGDGLFIDEVFLGRPMEAQVENPDPTVVPDAGSDALGAVAAAPQTRLYALNNVGHLDLDIDLGSFVFSNENNVSNISVTAPTTTPVPAGATVTFQVDFEPGLGDFSFDVSFDAVDPQLFDGVYNFTIGGEGNEALPEIDVQRPEGTTLADGATDDVGVVTSPGNVTLTYTISIVGFVALDISDVSIENADNATAETGTPPATIAPNESAELEVTYSVDNDGSFSFDVVIANSDSDEDPYTITVSGFADTGSGQVGGGGDGGSGGEGGNAKGSIADGGCGCRAPAGRDDEPIFWALVALGVLVWRRRRAA